MSTPPARLKALAGRETVFSIARWLNGVCDTWWSQTGSNRRPHACKARALPTELWPLFRASSARAVIIRRRLGTMVGPGRLELPTSRLSGVRSNHLSYGPSAAIRPNTLKGSHPRARDRTTEPQGLGSISKPVRSVERETKTAAPCTF